MYTPTNCSFVEKTSVKQSIKHEVLKKGRCTPQLSLVLQSPTTPGQYDLLKNADVPSADLPPANWA